MNISKIDQFCKLYKLSWTDLEERAGIGNGSIGKWQRSVNGPSIRNLKKVADYFRVSIDALIVDDDF